MRFVYIVLPPEMETYQLTPIVAIAAPPKVDPAVSFVGATPEGLFTFEVAPYDLASANRVNAVRVVLVPDGSEFPDSPEDAVDPAKTAHPQFRTDTSALQAGGQVGVNAGAAPAGKYSALAIVEFDA